MVLPVIAIVGGTIVASLIPFFFPTPAETATVELNQKLSGRRFQLKPITTRDSNVNDQGFQLDEKKTFIIVIIIIIILLVVFTK